MMIAVSRTAEKSYAGSWISSSTMFSPAQSYAINAKVQSGQQVAGKKLVKTIYQTKRYNVGNRRSVLTLNAKLSIMTKLMLEISSRRDLDVLLPLLQRLRIPYTEITAAKAREEEIAEAIAIIRQGCDMSNFGDALEYQIEQRKERILPFRD